MRLDLEHDALASQACRKRHEQTGALRRECAARHNQNP
jgi:hypothetical protein